MRVLPQAASSGADGGGTAAAAATAAEQLEKAFEERKVAQDSVREMAERYSALQEKFRHGGMRIGFATYRGHVVRRVAVVVVGCT